MALGTWTGRRFPPSRNKIYPVGAAQRRLIVCELTENIVIGYSNFAILTLIMINWSVKCLDG